MKIYPKKNKYQLVNLKCKVKSLTIMHSKYSLENSRLEKKMWFIKNGHIFPIKKSYKYVIHTFQILIVKISKNSTHHQTILYITYTKYKTFRNVLYDFFSFKQVIFLKQKVVFQAKSNMCLFKEYFKILKEKFIVIEEAIDFLADCKSVN